MGSVAGVENSLWVPREQLPREENLEFKKYIGEKQGGKL